MTESIATIEELNVICKKQESIIIYGAGVVGSLLVQYLLKNGYDNKLFCIAVKSMLDNPDNILGVPICELKDLVDYKENSLFIIGTYENLHAEIIGDLKALGCDKIVRMHNLLCATLRKNGTDFSVEIYNMQRLGFKTIYEKMIELEKRIDVLQETNEVCAINFNSFCEYENRFRNREIVIMGAGPTLNYYVPIEGAIHIGVNTAYLYDKVKPDYLFVQDANRDYDYKEKFKGLDKLNCPIFMGRYLHASSIKDIEFPEDCRINPNVHNFYLDLYPSKYIYKNICFHPVMDFGSVVFSALHFALYTYPRKIYLVGCDSNNRGYFSNSNHIVQRESMQDRRARWLPGYQRVKEHAKIHYPETEIISINPVGLKGIFRDIFTDNYLKEQIREEQDNE